MQEVSHDGAPIGDEPWRSPLEELEQTLSEVRRALSALRTSLESGGEIQLPGVEVREPAVEKLEGPGSDEAPTAMPAASVADPTQGESVGDTLRLISKKSAAAGEGPEATADDEAQPAGFQAVWQRIKSVRQEGQGDGPSAAETAKPSEFAAPPTPASNEELRDQAEAVGKSRLSSFEGVWERLERERKERSDGDIEDIADVRGLEHLPQSYRITVEDRDGTPVDLVPIHRALLTFAPADNISLVSFANGVPVVSLRTDGELDLERLSEVIGAATSRQCEVIPQDKGKLFLRLSSAEGNES